MLQAIQTKYLPPTNTRGARIKAAAEAGSVTVPYDHALNAAGNHIAAARAFILKWDWDRHGQWVTGQLSDGAYCTVCLESENR